MCKVYILKSIVTSHTFGSKLLKEGTLFGCTKCAKVYIHFSNFEPINPLYRKKAHFWGAQNVHHVKKKGLEVANRELYLSSTWRKRFVFTIS